MDELKNQTQSEFLKDLEPENKDVFDEPLTAEEETPKEEETEEDEGFKAKNRRERRLLTQNQRLREEAIANAARAQALSEVNKFREEVGDDPLKKVEAIFGTDTPEKLAATNILKEALSGMSDRAKQSALNEIEERQVNESQAVRKEEQNLDDIADRMEDEYGINMEAEGKAYFTLLEKLSPKDEDGNVLEYADPDTTAELYLERKGKSNGRAKELSSRSMTRSGASTESKLQDDSTVRFLKENGIIF